MKIITASIILSILFVSSTTWAEGRSYERDATSEQTGQQMRGPGGKMGPPQEAISACEGQSNGDECSFETPHGTLNGTCRKVPEGVVACVPNDHGRRRPPPQDGR